MAKTEMKSEMNNDKRPQNLAVAALLVGIGSLLVAVLLLFDRAEMPMVPIQPYTVVLLVLGLLLFLATVIVGVLALVRTIRAKSPFLWLAAGGLVVGLVGSAITAMAALVVSSKLM